MTLLSITQNKLNSINNQITSILASATNEETGEISEDVLQSLESLELAKNDIIQVCGLSFHQYKSLAEQVKNEKLRLNNLQKQYENSMERFKNLIDKVLAGETFECADFKVSYRKSTSYDLDEGTTIEWLPKEFQRVKTELDKEAIKDFEKSTGTLPVGIIKKTNNNIQIK